MELLFLASLVHLRSLCSILLVCLVFLQVAHQRIYGLSRSACPKICECYNSRTICSNKNLLYPPPGISNDTISIDFSNNPNIHIPKRYFLQFKNLKTIKFESSNLNKCMLLPRHIQSVDFEHNALTLENVNCMFMSDYLPFLRTIDIGVNNITVVKAISFKTPNLKKLIINTNEISVVTPETFRKLPNLVDLRLEDCRIKEIKHKSLDRNVKLQELYLKINQLQSLPQNFFLKLNELVRISFSHNEFTELPNLKGLPKQVTQISFSENSITSLESLLSSGIKSIGTLDLRANKIRTLPANIFQNICVNSLFLSQNGLEELKPMSFTGCGDGPHYYFSFSSNNLSYLDRRAFSGMKKIGVLALFHNNISSVSPETFNNIKIGQLLLHKNNISETSGLLSGLAGPPKLVTLFDNPITEIGTFGINNSDFDLHITCKNLHSLMLNQAHPRLKCSPSKRFEMIFQINLIINEIAHSMSLKCIRTRKMWLIYKCKPCNIGFYKPLGRSVYENCLPCPFGMFYQDELAQFNCKRCPPGQYVQPSNSSGKGKLDCKTCPKGTMLDKYAGYRACRCLPGFARRKRFGPCFQCKEHGIICKEYKSLRNGYWWHWSDNDLEAYKAFVNNLNMFNDDYNRSTQQFTKSYPTIFSCPIKEACIGGISSKCHEGYKGPVCAVCKNEFFKKVNQCVKCPSKTVSGVTLISGFLLFIVFVGIINYTDSIPVKFHSINSELNKSRLLSSVILSVFKILLGFIQTIIVLARVLPQSTLLSSTLTEILALYIQIFSLEILTCLFPNVSINSIKLQTISISILASFILAAALLFFLLKCCMHLPGRSYLGVNIHQWAKQLVRATSLFVFIQMPGITTGILFSLPLQCHDMCLLKNKQNICRNSINYMRTDYSVNCRTELYRGSLKYNMLYSALCIPVMYTFLVLFVLKKLNKKLVNINEALLNIEENNTRAIVEYASSFFVENYHQRYWYWEVVNFMYRSILLASLVFIVDRPFTCYSFALIFTWLFCILYAYKQPVRFRFENCLQALTFLLLCLYLSVDFLLQFKNITQIIVLSNAVTIASSTLLTGSGIIWLMYIRCKK